MNILFYYPDTTEVEASAVGEDIYLEWEPGKKFHSIFYKAENAKASVYFLPGNAGNLTSWKSIGEILMEEGYNVFLIDYPGFGNSDKTPRHNRIQKAAQVGLDYFLNRSEVSDSKKLIMGMSLGGNLAVKIGVENQDKLDGMIVEGAFSSHRKVGFSRMAPVLRPLAFCMVRNTIKGERIIKKWKKPLLVVHSEEDKVCLYKFGKELYENCSSAEKELWTIQGRHIEGLALYREEYMNKMDSLVTK